MLNEEQTKQNYNLKQIIHISKSMCNNDRAIHNILLGLDVEQIMLPLFLTIELTPFFLTYDSMADSLFFP